MRYLGHLPLGSRLQRAWQAISNSDREALTGLRKQWPDLNYSQKITYLDAIRTTTHYKQFSNMELASMFDVQDETEM